MTEVAKKRTTPRKTAAKKKVMATAESPAVPTHEDVELRAYQLWEVRGRQHGHDAHDWLRAEAQLRANDSSLD